MNPTFPRRRTPSLFWPIILIGVGVMWLLYNLGWLTASPWWLIGQLWPLLLILIGVDMLVGRNSTAGAVISALLAVLIIAGLLALLLIAQWMPTTWNVPSFLRPPDLQNEHIVYPLEQTRTADVTLSYGSGNGSLHSLNNSINLIEGDVGYYGALINQFSRNGDDARVALRSQLSTVGPIFFDRGDTDWNLSLNPSVAYDLHLEQGSGRTNLDLSAFDLRSLSLEVASGSSTISLPTRGQYQFRLEVHSGSAQVFVPANVSVRVEYSVSSGSLNASGLKRVRGTERDGVYESDGFTQNASAVTIRADVSSGSVNIATR